MDEVKLRKVVFYCVPNRIIFLSSKITEMFSNFHDNRFSIFESDPHADQQGLIYFYFIMEYH